MIKCPECGGNPKAVKPHRVVFRGGAVMWETLTCRLCWGDGEILQYTYDRYMAGALSLPPTQAEIDRRRREYAERMRREESEAQAAERAARMNESIA